MLSKTFKKYFKSQSTILLIKLFFYYNGIDLVGEHKN